MHLRGLLVLLLAVTLTLGQISFPPGDYAQNAASELIALGLPSPLGYPVYLYSMNVTVDAGGAASGYVVLQEDQNVAAYDTIKFSGQFSCDRQSGGLLFSPLQCIDDGAYCESGWFADATGGYATSYGFATDPATNLTSVQLGQWLTASSAIPLQCRNASACGQLSQCGAAYSNPTVANLVVTGDAAVGGALTVAGTISGQVATPTPRSLISKLSDTVSVQDYGAVCDGVTDDYQSLQNALNSGASTILLPSATCLTGRTLVLPASGKITGNGQKRSFIQLKNGADVPVMFLPSSAAAFAELVLQDFTVDGNYAGQAAGLLSAHCLYMNYSVSLQLRSTSWQNCAGDGVYGYGTSMNVYTSYSWFEYNRGNGMTLVGSDAQIFGSQIGQNQGHGLYLSGGVMVLVSGNAVFYNRGFGIFQTSTSGGYSLSDNVIQYNFQGGIFTSGPACVVANNIFQGNSNPANSTSELVIDGSTYRGGANGMGSSLFNGNVFLRTFDTSSFYPSYSVFFSNFTLTDPNELPVISSIGVEYGAFVISRTNQNQLIMPPDLYSAVPGYRISPGGQAGLRVALVFSATSQALVTPAIYGGSVVYGAETIPGGAPSVPVKLDGVGPSSYSCLSINGTCQATASYERFAVNQATFQISVSNTPSTSSAFCLAGDLNWDVNYLYVCTAGNTWKRIALASF